MKLLIGPAHSGKTNIIHGRITKAIRDGRRDVLLIVPSSLSSGIIWERLQTTASAAVETTLVKENFVGDFPKLYTEILLATGANRRLIRDITRRRLLRRIITDLARENAFFYFDKIAGKPGLVDAIAAFLDDLRRSGTDASEFARLTEAQSSKDSDVALIYGRYESALQFASHTDTEGAALLALRALEAAAKQGSGRALSTLRSRFSFIAADGFDCYTPVQVRVLALLDEVGIETVAALTYENDRAVHLWQQPTRRRFEAAKAEMLPLQSMVDTPHVRAAKALMTDGATEDNKTEREGEQPVKIISAPDRTAEVRAIAHEIKHLTGEHRLAFEEITVLCRSLNLYAHHFERVFDEHGIPLQIDAALPLGENPCVVSLMGLLRLAADSFPRRAVMDSLRSAYFDWSSFELDSETTDILERLSFEEFITQGRNQWVEAILKPTKTPAANKANKADREDGATAEEELRQKREHLAAKLERAFDAVTFPKFANEGEYVHRINSLIEVLRVGERARVGATAARDEAALTAFRELLAAFGESDGVGGDVGEESTGFEESRRISWGAFFEEFERAFFASSFARPEVDGNDNAGDETVATSSLVASSSAIRGDGRGRVVVQEVHQQRPQTYRAIFVAGLVEGEFPRKVSESAPYTLAERENLRRAGVDLAETSHDAGADLTQFHKAMTRASEQLYLSYARTDLAGGELLRSYLIDEVINVAETETITIKQIETGLEALEKSAALSLEELAQATARALGGSLAGRRSATDAVTRAAEAALQSSLKSWSATVRGAAIEQRRLSGRERGMFGGFVLNEELVRRVGAKFGADYLWSASRINDYGQCPFLFFARDVLSLQPAVEPAESFAADRLGDAYHKILERTFFQLKKRGIELSEATLEDAVRISDEAGEEVLEEMLEKREVRESRLWEFDKRDIKKRVVNLLRAEVEMIRERRTVPLAFEKCFGWAGEPPLVVETSAGAVKFTGVIDRIDESEEGLVVIDYKTRRSPISAREALDGRNLQLPIYLMAAEHLAGKDQPVAGGYYLHIGSCKRGSEFPNKNASVEEVTEQARVYVGDYVSRVRRAEFPVEPKTRDCDAYCRYNVMCRIQSLGVTRDEE